jgi:carbamoylphosphate synthase small subunit
MVLCDATDDVDTRAITRRLREDGSLIGVLSTDNSKTDEELLQMSKSWDIVGKDMTIRGDCSNVFKTGITCLLFLIFRY